MRDFTWSYFSMTGDVNAYLLYRQVTEPEEQEQSAADIHNNDEEEVLV